MGILSGVVKRYQAIYLFALDRVSVFVFHVVEVYADDHFDVVVAGILFGLEGGADRPDGGKRLDGDAEEGGFAFFGDCTFL